MSNELFGSLTFGILIQNDGLNVEEMTKYFTDNDVTVKEMIETTVEIGNKETDKDRECECTIFILETKGFFISVKIRWDMNLKEIPGCPHMYMPVDREWENYKAE